MIYIVEYLTTALKKAREDKQLSQRALSRKVGMPQAQISKIENATVDLKTSSLIELARSLDLEVMLVPRKYMPAVKSLNNVSENDATTQRPAYSLNHSDNDD